MDIHRFTQKVWQLVTLALLLLIWQQAAAAPAATFTVNTSSDLADLVVGDGHCDVSTKLGDQCSLRAAIQESNSLTTADVIVFDSLVMLIQPTSALPALNTDDRNPTIIYGAGVVTLDGSSAGAGVNGLVLQSNGHTIQGLVITSFDGCGLRISGNKARIGVMDDGISDNMEGNRISGNASHGICIEGGDNNHIAGNKIGTNAVGTLADGNGGAGIHITGDADSNIIGTDGDDRSDVLERNLISGNGDYGIYTYVSGAEIANTIIAGNYIGVNASGTAALPNAAEGIKLEGNNLNAIIGTNGNGVADAAEGNLISGNPIAGINAYGSTGTVIAGNYIGVDVSGQAVIPNETGVYAGNGTRIGTNANGLGDAEEGNLISGNEYDGIVVESDISGVVIAGNTIGVNADGDTAIPNNYGINLSGENNRIGGVELYESNLISGNTDNGIEIGGYNNWVVNNQIGTDLSGEMAIPNGQSGGWETAGIYLSAENNTIGTNGDGVDDDAEGNLIAGNYEYGIYVVSSGNVIAGNYIGTDLNGMQSLLNQAYGVYLGSGDNLVGTNGDGVSDLVEGNLISGNSHTGIYIEHNYNSGNIIAGNSIGVNANGDTKLGNAYGVYIDGSPDNRIGTDGDNSGDAAERNIISGNSNAGINISGLEASGNWIAGNYIGLNASGDAALANGGGDWGVGIAIGNAPGTLIGSNADGVADAAERNVISGNNSGGIYIHTNGTDGGVIAGNYIGTDASGALAIPNGNASWNGDQAVLVNDSIVRIGSNGDGSYDTAERNVISGNYGWGIRVFIDSSGTVIAGNYIGVNAAGSGALGNSKSGVYLDDATAVSVGGTQPAEQNIIAFNGGDGVTIGPDPASTSESGILVRGNAIYGNSGLGIDLGDDGVSANDSGDGDNGPNQLQNYPVLTSASGTATTITINGSLNSKASTSFNLDFYASPSCDPSGYGEGQFYLGSQAVSTNASGSASFSANFNIAVPNGYLVTAVAVESSNNNTSEFSQCITAASTYVPPSLSIANASLVEGDSGLTEMVFTVSLSAPAQTTITVQYGSGGGTATANMDYLATAGTLTFTSGQSSQTIAVPIIGDHTVESDETFLMTLSNPYNATIATGQATGTILNDDSGDYQIFLPLLQR